MGAPCSACLMPARSQESWPRYAAFYRLFSNLVVRTFICDPSCTYLTVMIGLIFVSSQSEAVRKAEEAAEKAKQDELAKERKRKNVDLD